MGLPSSSSWLLNDLCSYLWPRLKQWLASQTRRGVGGVETVMRMERERARLLGREVSGILLCFGGKMMFWFLSQTGSEYQPKHQIPFLSSLATNSGGEKELARRGCSWKLPFRLQVSQTGLGLPSETHLVSQPCWPNYKVILVFAPVLRKSQN